MAVRSIGRVRKCLSKENLKLLQSLPIIYNAWTIAIVLSVHCPNMKQTNSNAFKIPLRA